MREFWKKIGKENESGSGKVVGVLKIQEEWIVLVFRGKVRAKLCEGEL